MTNTESISSNGDSSDDSNILRSLSLVDSGGAAASVGLQEMSPLVRDRLEDSKQDRELKKKYATWFFLVLVLQLGLMNLVFIGVGWGSFRFDKWTLELYLFGTLLEVFGVVYVITKNLFPVLIRENP